MNRILNIAHPWATLCLMLTLLASCSEKTIDPSTPLPPTDATPIAFSTADAFTKAPINSLDEFQTEGNTFRVWGWFEGITPGHMFYEDDQTRDDGTTVTYKNSTWTYSPTRYWMNGTYDFAAVYPSTVEAAYAPVTEGVRPSLAITNFNITNQDDLLVAIREENGGNPPSSVALNFQHALTKINIKIKQDIEEDPDNEYKITKVRLSGIKFVGSCDASVNNNALTLDWEPDITSASYFEKTFAEPESLKNNNNNGIEELFVWGENQGLLIIPQTIEAYAIQIQIEFDYIRSGNDTINKRSVSGYIPVPDSNSQYLWEPGKVITYTISIAQQDNIKFSAPTVELWGNSQSGSTIII